MNSFDVLLAGWLTLAWGFAVLYLAATSLCKCKEDCFKKQNEKGDANHEQR